MKEKLSRKKTVFATVILFILLAILALVYMNSRSATVAGSKEVTIEVIVPEDNTKAFILHTDALYLKDALDEYNLIDGTDSGFGFFITEVNNRVADDANQEWWCITKEGEEVFEGVSDIVISNEDKYELTLMIGY